MISKQTWLRLAPSDREILMTAAKESVPYQRALWSKFEKESKKQLEQAGCKFNSVDEDAFRVDLENFYHKHAKQYENLIYYEIKKIQ